MVLTNRKTLVSKTASVASVKLTTPADRIGLGRVVANAYPTDNLSQGQFPLPRNPEPEQVRSRQSSSVTRMRKQMRAAADTVPPASSVGCLRVPVSSAVRSVVSFTANPLTGWQPATGRTAAAGRSASDRGSRLPADPSQARVQGALRSDHRLGSDCQSPDRRTDKRGTATERVLAATTRK
jgi:hypothetical protein